MLLRVRDGCKVKLQVHGHGASVSRGVLFSSHRLHRYQFILLGEQSHMRVNNLPRVVMWDSNLRPLCCKSDVEALTTTQPGHTYTGWRKKNGAILSHCKYSENFMTELRGNW